MNTEEPNPDPLLTHSEEESEVVKQEPGITVKKMQSDSRDPLPSRIKKKKLKFRLIKRQNETVNREVRRESSSIIEDEFQIYGKYIASQLRQMNLQKALRLQLAIQNLISEARISDMNTK